MNEIEKQQSGKAGGSVDRARGGRDVREVEEGSLEWLALTQAAGSTSPEFISALLSGIGSVVGANGKAADWQIKAALTVLEAAAPDNALEALLVGQMIAANDGATRCMRLMNQAAEANQSQVFGNLATKFQRTFTAQMEALNKIRRGGEQVVKHVHVYEGGQAVVAGTINQHREGGGNNGTASQSDAANAIAGIATLPRQDPQRDALPVAGHAERSVPDARRDEPRRANGE